MAVKTQAMVTTLKVFVADLAGPEASAFLARAHRNLHQSVLDKVSSQGRRIPTFMHFVDGQPNNNFDTVKPDGFITTEYRYGSEIIAEVLQMARANSPVEKGLYRNSFIVFVNGVHVESFDDVPETAEIHITNITPYVRRLEVGLRDDGTPFSQRVPPHIIERTVIEARQRFGNVATINFTYIDLLAGIAPNVPYILKGDQPKRHFLRSDSGSLRRVYVEPTVPSDRRAGEAIRYPAIVIRAL